MVFSNQKRNGGVGHCKVYARLERHGLFPVQTNDQREDGVFRNGYCIYAHVDGVDVATVGEVKEVEEPTIKFRYEGRKSRAISCKLI
ncbi:hypothetical protein VNO77_05687 [Canavalia gladiata]|uniref:Uncharacterized protein n=1 Tax=Canavalia gladiata TaxID=3824 RepID=A0AAN9MZJ8_CANGL